MDDYTVSLTVSNGIGENTNCELNETSIQALSVYPNPVNEFINLKLQNIQEDFSIMIYNEKGQIINCNYSVENNNCKIETGNLSAGLK